MSMPAIDLAAQPAPKPALPPGYRLVSNRIQCARISHRLDCGCHVKPGQHYHYIAMVYAGQIVYIKRHLWGCIEVLH